MGSVTFYKAQIINEANRFAKSAIANYLKGCPSKEFTQDTLMVQPNTPFYVTDFFTSLADAAEYNYISYNCGGETYYALILDLSQLSDLVPPQGITIQVRHVVDAIATYGDGIFDPINGIYASGTAVRAHVNDWAWSRSAADSVPINTHYLPASEEIVNNANIRYTRFTPDQAYRSSYYEVTTYAHDTLSSGSTTSSNVTTYIIGYLLVYISNADAVFASGSATSADQFSSVVIETNRGTSQGVDKTRVPTQGLSCIFGLGYYGVSGDIPTMIGLYKDGSGSSNWVDFYIPDLKNEYITSMCFLPLIWDPATVLEYNSNLTRSITSTERNGLTRYVRLFPQGINTNSLETYIRNCGFYYKNTTGSYVYDTYGFRYSSASVLTWGSNATYEKYIECMYSKLRTAPYFNLQIEDTAIISLFWDGSYEFQAALDCSGFLVHSNWTNVENDYSIISTSNLGMFAPAVINDYWTRLDATQESILANINQTQNVMGVVSSAVNFATTAATAVAGAASGMMTEVGAAKASGGVLGAATGLISNLATYSDKKHYYSNQQEIAEHQSQVGQTRDVAVLGVLQLQDSYVVPAVKAQYLTDAELYKLGDLIHKKGYVTNIPISQLAAHKRDNFNYVMSTDYNITGLPIAISRELQDLFARGLWIWHDADPQLSSSDWGTDLYSHYLNSIVTLETIT